VQKHVDTSGLTRITPTAQISGKAHGGRAKCLQRLIRLDLPVPATVALSFGAVHDIAKGHLPDAARILETFGPAPLVSVRPSSEDPDWGGPGAILNIGLNYSRHAALVETLGEAAADALYVRFIQSYAVHVARLDPEMFETGKPGGPTSPALALAAYEAETDERFPQAPADQLTEVLRSMARAWEGTSARLLRTAKGAPADAGLGLVVQQMADVPAAWAVVARKELWSASSFLHSPKSDIRILGGMTFWSLVFFFGVVTRMFWGFKSRWTIFKE
jgi:pyruvate,orthophosphate dikinase